MKKKHSSVEGFVVRRPNNPLGASKSKKHTMDGNSGHSFERPALHNGDSQITRRISKPQAGLGLGRVDVKESLESLDAKPQPVKKMSRRELRKLKKLAKKKHPIRRRIIKIFIFLIIAGIIATGGYMGYKVLNASHNVVQGNIFDIFKSQALKEDENGRSTFLILGTSEDDNGHAGADLTDSLLVVSVNQTDKNIYMFSVPRDLYVEYNEACMPGYSGKINAYFSCSNEGTTPEAEQDRLTKTQKFIGDIFGIDIQYGIHVNHTVIKQVVDAIGGVDVDIQGSNGDPGVYDRNFDWRCKYSCYYVKYDNGVHHLDGTHALFLAMARGDIAPTYGLGNSNFDREKNQQKILIAMRDKALTAGTLTNLGAVTKLIDALGANLRTNIQTGEIQTLMKIASEVKTTDMNMISLVDGDDTVMGTGMYNGASVVMPRAGIYKYTDIQNYIAKKISSDPVVREAAPIAIFNGSGVTGYGKTMGDGLTAKGYSVSLIDTAPEGTYEKVEIYQIGTASPETAKKLSTLYGVVIKTTKPPVTVMGNTQFVIIYGATSEPLKQ